MEVSGGNTKGPALSNGWSSWMSHKVLNRGVTCPDVPQVKWRAGVGDCEEEVPKSCERQWGLNQGCTAGKGRLLFYSQSHRT